MNDLQSIRTSQTRDLRALCSELVQSNPFYAPRLKAAGLDFETLTPEEFSRAMPFTTRAEWTQDQVENPPFGTNLTYPMERYVRCFRTSGSTGQPMTWLDTAASLSSMLDVWERVFEAAGMVGQQRIFFAFSFGPFFGFWTAYGPAARLGHMCIPAGGASTKTRLKLLMDIQAEVVCCTPTYAIRMAHVADQEGIDLGKMNVKAIIVAGEPGGSIPSVRDHISEHWRGARVLDHHGMTEVGPVTYECPAEPGVLHVMEKHFLAEVVEDELVLTTLRRNGSPLLRYRTGDVVSAERRTPCACGSEELRLLGGILGRKDDMVIVRGVNIFPSAIENIVRSMDDVDEYQVELFTSNDLAEMKVCIESEGGAASCRELQRRFQEALLIRIPVELRPRGSLPRYDMKAKRWIRLDENTE